MKRKEAITFMGAAGIMGMLQPNNLVTGNTKKMSKNTNDKSTMKTIGILGGIGPQATMSLEQNIHQASQRLIPRAFNSGYPPMVSYYYRHAPVLLKDENVPIFPFQPDPRLLDAAKSLGAISDFLLIASNGIHLFQNEIEKAAGLRVLSMIDVTLEEVKKRKWKKVGVLTFKIATIYTDRLKEMNIQFETIDKGLQEQLDNSIMKVMEGREDAEDRRVAEQAIASLRANQLDGIILGCTEIPFLLQTNGKEKDLVDPAQLLAEAAVKYSIG